MKWIPTISLALLLSAFIAWPSGGALAHEAGAHEGEPAADEADDGEHPEGVEGAGLHAEEQEAEEEVVVTGEVIDLTCYFAHPLEGQGPEHASCARQCAERGLPMGILVRDQGDGPTDGRLYLALGQDHTDASGLLAPYAGTVIRVRGNVKTQNGLQAIEIREILE